MIFKLPLMSQCEHSQGSENNSELSTKLQLPTHRETVTLSHFQDFVIIGATLKVIETFELSYGLTEDESDE